MSPAARTPAPAAAPVEDGAPLVPKAVDLLSLAGLLSVLIFMFTRSFNAHPPYPQRDPRVAESMGVYVEPASSKAAH